MGVNEKKFKLLWTKTPAHHNIQKKYSIFSWGNQTVNLTNVEVVCGRPSAVVFVVSRPLSTFNSAWVSGGDSQWQRATLWLAIQPLKCSFSSFFTFTSFLLSQKTSKAKLYRVQGLPSFYNVFWIAKSTSLHKRQFFKKEWWKSKQQRLLVSHMGSKNSKNITFPIMQHDNIFSSAPPCLINAHFQFVMQAFCYEFVVSKPKSRNSSDVTWVISLDKPPPEPQKTFLSFHGQTWLPSD